MRQTESEVDSLDITLHEVVVGPDGTYDFDAREEPAPFAHRRPT
jgi:hypothetical protein